MPAYSQQIDRYGLQAVQHPFHHSSLCTLDVQRTNHQLAWSRLVPPMREGRAGMDVTEQDSVPIPHLTSPPCGCLTIFPLYPYGIRLSHAVGNVIHAWIALRTCLRRRSDAWTSDVAAMAGVVASASGGSAAVSTEGPTMTCGLGSACMCRREHKTIQRLPKTLHVPT